MSGARPFRDVKLQWLQQLSCDKDLSDSARSVALYIVTTHLNGHTEKVNCFAWQPGGEYLASGGRDWRLNLWRPQKAREAIDVQMLDSEVTATRWSPDGKYLVAGEKKGRVTLYELVSK